ncbi:MAG TPA: hypothetical protein VN915_16230 [Elusimicrobiota bacterium]|nr:hypothetical protein [Elusimicrobiota bacterium]
MLRADRLRGEGADPSLELADRFRAEISRGRFVDAFALGERALDEKPSAGAYEALLSPVSPGPGGASRPLYELLELLRRDRSRGHAAWRRHLRLVLLEKLGWPEEALSLSEELEGLPARYAWMRFNRGQMLLNLRWAYGDAEREFRAVLKSAPAFWTAEACLAESALCRGRPKSAFETMSRCVERLRSRPTEFRKAAIWRGELNLWTGRYDAAAADFQPYADEGMPLALCWRGAALLRSGSIREALSDLNESIRLSPRDAETLVWRGEALRLDGQVAPARRDLDEALRLNGSNVWAQINRALCASAAGDAAGFWSDFDLLPARVLRFFEWKLALAVERDAGKGRSLLEGILAAARGIRRPELYLYPLWMDLGR